MLIGGSDSIVDQSRCAEVAADMRAGGSRVDTIVYPGAVHQWDGAFASRLIGRNLAGCSRRVERDGTIRDTCTGLAMSGFSRAKLSSASARSEPANARSPATIGYGRRRHSIGAAFSGASSLYTDRRARIAALQEPAS